MTISEAVNGERRIPPASKIRAVSFPYVLPRDITLGPKAFLIDGFVGAAETRRASRWQPSATPPTILYRLGSRWHHFDPQPRPIAVVFLDPAFDNLRVIAPNHFV